MEDSGIGEDADPAERLFRVFERLHRQKAYPGIGAALAVVKKVVGWRRRLLDEHGPA